MEEQIKFQNDFEREFWTQVYLKVFDENISSKEEYADLALLCFRERNSELAKRDEELFNFLKK